MSVATTLREERIRRGITAEQLGKRVGVSKSCICQYERQDNGKVCDRCENWAIQLLAEIKKKALGEGLKRKNNTYSKFSTLDWDSQGGSLQ